ncbi:hypothetical protein PR048_002144 [Dryococelus australis]|uniref:Uncharacterized protein n=1 Tax=Dryococelus australis TaxID=614101 RepID=A0ABQ9IKS0_9NEOP|nr:hypothetical protein PR048_002144 [Dryococelus australis]
MNHLASSMLGSITRRREKTLCHHLVQYDMAAIDLYEKENGINVQKCGSFVNTGHPYLGARLDGLVGENKLLEEKYLYSLKDQSLREAVIVKKKVNCSWKELMEGCSYDKIIATITRLSVLLGTSISGKKKCCQNDLSFILNASFPKLLTHVFLVVCEFVNHFLQPQHRIHFTSSKDTDATACFRQSGCWQVRFFIKVMDAPTPTPSSRYSPYPKTTCQHWTIIFPEFPSSTRHGPGARERVRPDCNRDNTHFQPQQG